MEALVASVGGALISIRGSVSALTLKNTKSALHCSADVKILHTTHCGTLSTCTVDLSTIVIGMASGIFGACMDENRIASKAIRLRFLADT